MTAANHFIKRACLLRSQNRNSHLFSQSPRFVQAFSSINTTKISTNNQQNSLRHNHSNTSFNEAPVNIVPRPHVDPTLSYAFGKSNENMIYSTVDREFRRKALLVPDEQVFSSFFENKQVTYRQFNKDVDRLTKSLLIKYSIKKGDAIGIFAYNCYNWLVCQMACSRLGAVLAPINPSYKEHELAYILQQSNVKCLFMSGPKSLQSIELNNHLNVLLSDKIIELSREGNLKHLESVIFMDNNINYELDELDLLNKKLPKIKFSNWSDTQDNDGLLFMSLNEAKQSNLYNNLKDDEDLLREKACIYDHDHLVSPDDIFGIYYTSGTTGLPKGARISQFVCINNVKFCQSRLRHGRHKNFRFINVTTLPMFHIFAGVLNTLAPIMANCEVIYSSYKYDIATMAQAIIKHNANCTTLTPTILIDLVRYIEQNNLQSTFPLRLVQSGGAHLSPEVINKTFKILPNLEELRLGYGSTENGAVSTLQTIHEPSDLKPFTVGPPMDFTEVRIVKPNTDQLMPLGEKGEIHTRGYNTMLDYFNDPKKTKEVLTTTKWYKTGDMGIMHPHGSLQISGRLKSLIIKGGENIYPEEVELMIHKLDYVEDVHVVGVPDKRFGEQVCAWVKLKPGYKGVESKSELSANNKEISKEEIIQFCKKNMTYFKVPKYLLFVDDFPVTPTKKVQSHVMTEQSIKILKLEEHLESTTITTTTL